MSLGRFIADMGQDGISRIDFNTVFNCPDATIEELTAAQRLLVRIYTGIYCTTFPMPSERDDIREWFYRLYGGEMCASIQFFSAYGKNLEDPENAEIAGFIVSEFFKGNACGIICYVIREQAYKKDLSAKSMCDRHEVLMREVCVRLDGRPLRAVFWEANDYRAIMAQSIDASELMNPVAKRVYKNIVQAALDTGEDMDEKDIADFEQAYFALHGYEYWHDIDCMDPRKRDAHIQKAYNARKVGFYYVQTPLVWYETIEEREAMSSDCMNLYVYNSQNYPDFDISDVRGYINFFATVFSRAKSPEDLGLASVDKMMAQVRTIEECGISVWEDQQSATEMAMIYASEAPHKDRSTHEDRDTQHAV